MILTQWNAEYIDNQEYSGVTNNQLLALNWINKNKWINTSIDNAGMTEQCYKDIKIGNKDENKKKSEGRQLPDVTSNGKAGITGSCRTLEKVCHQF